jgi:hypothetical protein
MSISIPELLVNDGFITPGDQVKIKSFSERSGMAYVKIALNFGYISRKNYERSLSNAGYHFAQIREEAFDTEVLKKIELKFANDHLALPLRIENNRVVTFMADPSDQLF